MVVIGAGEIEVGGGAHYYARYIIDKRAQVCWFFAGDSVSQLECCSLYRVDDARPFLTWLSAAACDGAAPQAKSAHASMPDQL